MAQAYGSAKTYADNGQIRLRFKQGGEQIDDTADFAVSLVRPGKFRLHCYQAMAVSDGKTLKARITDLDSQLLETSTPSPLTQEALYAVDPVLSAVLTGGIAGAPAQIALLLDNDPLNELLSDGKVTPVLVGQGAVEGHNCNRVKLSQSEGSIVLWIDQQTHVLRRVDFPSEVVAKFFQQAGNVEDLELWVELLNARFDEPIADDAFALEVPSDVRRVEHFDPSGTSPPPQPPSKMLGKAIPSFTFVDLAGKPVSNETLADKIVVLDFWATWCQPCRESLPNLQQVYDKYKDNPKVAFYAVSVDQASVANEALEKSWETMGLHLPILRDSGLAARDAFGVEGIPNLFVLANGKVQDSEVGFNPNLAVELPESIDKLLAGENIYALAQKRYEERVAAYEKQQAAAGTAAAPPTKVEIAAASQPTTFALEELWNIDSLDRPGNILVVRSAQAGVAPKLVVNDSWARVVEIGSDGAILAKHDLKLPPQAAITYLRTALDASGRRWYAGSAGAQPLAHVFDDSFATVLSLPKNPVEVSDICLADLDGNGTVEISVGCWGSQGVQCFATDGKPLWTNDTSKNILNLAATGPDSTGQRQLWVTHQEGTLAIVDSAGKSKSSATLANRFLRLVRAANLDGGPYVYCGLAPGLNGVDSLVGLSQDGREQWSYNLPAGLHEHPIEMVTHGDLLGSGGGSWIAAGADGSVHLVGIDGKPLDQFNSGQVLTGIAAANWDGQSVLILSTPKHVTAWRVVRRP